MNNNKTTNAGTPDIGLFCACLVALVTTSFGFTLRSIVGLPAWGKQFNLTQTQFLNVPAAWL